MPARGACELWWLPLCWCALVAFALAALQRASLPEQPAVVQIDSAPSAAPDGSGLPPVTGPWQRYRLPLRTCQVRCETPWIVLRHRFDADTVAGGDWALYLPFFDANVAVYLNGRKLDQRGRMHPPADLYRYHSRLVLLPATALKPQANELLLHLVSEVRHLGGLGRFYVGAAAPLEAAQSWRALLTEGLVAGAAWLQAGSMLVVAVLFLFGRREEVQRWYLLAAPFWLLLALLHLLPDWPTPGYGRWLAMHAALLGCLGFTPLFIIAIVRQPPRWLVRSLLAFCAAAVLFAAVALLWWPLEPYWRLQAPNLVLKFASYMLVPWMLWLVVRIVAARGRTRSGPWLVVFAAMPALMGIADALVGSLAPPLEFAMLPLGAIGVVLALWLELARRVILSERRLAAHAQQLEATVRAREAELERSFERIREADRERALGAERARLLRDMHDGVGGQLASLVHLASDPRTGREQVVSGLREGLADLRLVLDSLAQGDDDLLVALGRLRHRLAPTLEAAGIRLVWEVDARIELPPWHPQAVLHLYRLVQEAVHNSIRHARARTLRVGLHAHGDGLRVLIEDDGTGFEPAAAAGRGYGLSGMHERAARLGGSLCIERPATGGARIVLDCPWQPPGADER